jgi:flavin reductase
MSINDETIAENFRQSLRATASAVTIISTQLHAVRHGMVATAVTSVSLDPPTLLVAINKNASIHGPLTIRKAFAVNYLSDINETVVRNFSAAKGEQRFSFGEWREDKDLDGSLPEGIPYLPDAQATAFCAVASSYELGTHTLFIGKVFRICKTQKREPLLYCNGDYGSFRRPKNMPSRYSAKNNGGVLEQNETRKSCQ